MSTLASGGVYSAADQLTSLAYLGGTESRTYNSLNQLTGVQLSTSVNLSYFYNAGFNNGQMASSVDSVHGQTVEYSYDALKRLSAAYYTTLNLLDPGFEQTGVTGWTLSGQAAVNDLQYRSWPYSLQTSGGSGTATGVCSANASYTVSGYYLTASGSSATVITTGATTTTQTLASATSWTAFSFTFAGPASCGNVSIALGGGQPGGSAYFDDVSLTSPSVSSGANQIGNPGFTALTVAWSVSSARLTDTVVHSGATSMLTTPAASIGQTVSGLTPNYPYTVSAYISGGAATLTAGSTNTTATGGSGWTEIHVTAASSSSGTLAITALASGSTNVYWDDFSMNASGVAGGQQFGYDGFGNLLSQTPIVGSAPMMNLAVNPNTNRVTSGGAVYDGAGNLTYDGTTHYAFDELNRLASAGTVNYSYSPGENKRMVVSGTINGQPTQLLDFFLYSPNGKLMSVFGYQKSGSSWQPTSGNQTNLFYLGSKALSFAENNVGSSTSGTFWPYGSGNTSGSGPRGFASYWGDWSGLYYADQRYYNQSWGRFLTADPSDANVDPTVSGSFNRYAYVDNDPINGNDPIGFCDVVIGGILQNSSNASSIEDYAGADGAISVYPYSQLSDTSSLVSSVANGLGAVLEVAVQKFGAQSSTFAAVTGLLLAAQDGQPINVTTFSGGAGALTAAVGFLNAQGSTGQSVVSMINSITYVAPGAAGTLYNNGNTSSIGGGPLNNFVGAATSINAPVAIYNDTQHCGHDFSCLMNEFPGAFTAGQACSNPVIVNQPDRSFGYKYFQPNQFGAFAIFDLPGGLIPFVQPVLLP